MEDQLVGARILIPETVWSKFKITARKKGYSNASEPIREFVRQFIRDDEDEKLA